jgi:hypothetical protein
LSIWLKRNSMLATSFEQQVDMKNLPAKEIALTRGAARFDTMSLSPRVDRPEMRSSSQRDEEQLVLNKINNFKFHFSQCLWA